jgi:hypothetical protein
VNEKQIDPCVDHRADHKLWVQKEIGRSLSGAIPKNQWYGERAGPSRQAAATILQELTAQNTQSKEVLYLNFVVPRRSM